MPTYAYFKELTICWVNSIKNVLFQEIAEMLKDLNGDVIASTPMTDFIKGYQTHKYLLPK